MDELVQNCEMMGSLSRQIVTGLVGMTDVNYGYTPISELEDPLEQEVLDFVENCFY